MERLLRDVAYLGRYAGQPASEVLEMPHSLRVGLVRAVSALVGEEKGDDG